MPTRWAGGSQGLMNVQAGGVLAWSDLFVTDGEAEAREYGE